MIARPTALFCLLLLYLSSRYCFPDERMQATELALGPIQVSSIAGTGTPIFLTPKAVL